MNASFQQYTQRVELRVPVRGRSQCGLDLLSFSRSAICPRRMLVSSESVVVRDQPKGPNRYEA